jgi:hypothetical protein
MDIRNEVNAVEAEVVNGVKKVEAVVVNEAEKIKTSILSQKTNFQTQLDNVKKDMTRLQQEFDKAKTLGVRLEGALEGLEILLKNLSSK